MNFAFSLRGRAILGNPAERGRSDEGNREEHHPDLQTDRRKHEAGLEHTMVRSAGPRDRLVEVRISNERYQRLGSRLSIP